MPILLLMLRAADADADAAVKADPGRPRQHFREGLELSSSTASRFLGCRGAGRDRDAHHAGQWQVGSKTMGRYVSFDGFVLILRKSRCLVDANAVGILGTSHRYNRLGHTQPVLYLDQSEQFL